MEEVKVVIVGAGPAGLATSACLNYQSIPNIVFEREDCSSPLWKKQSYDRLKLHLAKQFCELPHFPFPSNFPTFPPKKDFISYLDEYVTHFDICPKYHRLVESAYYDENREKWCLKVKNSSLDVYELYSAKFLIVAAGENSEGFIPQLPGLASFEGDVIHSSQYKNGDKYIHKNVLVVGSGNSGMEIAYDLEDLGVKTSIVVRSPVHVLNENIVYLGMYLLKYFRPKVVDPIVRSLAYLRYGDLSSYGIHKPSKGPFELKATTGRSPTIDVGTIGKIKEGKIQVHQSITSIERRKVIFANKKENQFDAIIFATGYRSTVRKWLKGGEDLFNENGMPKISIPNLWKGQNGLYSAGFARQGLLGISNDAQKIANDISFLLHNHCNNHEQKKMF